MDLIVKSLILTQDRICSFFFLKEIRAISRTSEFRARRIAIRLSLHNTLRHSHTQS